MAQITPPPSSVANPNSVRYMLRDANYNVAGIVRDCDSTLIRQFRYDPYGTITAAEDVTGPTPTAADPLESWHMFQGLMYDPATATPTRTGLHHARGRDYRADLGRPLQRDPNGQGLVLSSGLPMNGQTLAALASISASAQYIDGMNPYQFVGGNPVRGVDPSGLLFAWDVDINDAAAAYYADRAATQIEVIEQARALMRGVQAYARAMAERLALEVAATAIWKPAPYGFAAFDVLEASLFMAQHGASWGGAAGLAAALYGVKAARDVGGALGVRLRKGQKRSAGLGIEIDDNLFKAHLQGAERRYRKRLPIGSFSVRDWAGYPSGVRRPSRPFRLLEGAEYAHARKAANRANKRLRRQNPGQYAGKEIHEIQPVKYGGSPTDPMNKIALTPGQHQQYTVFWGRLQRKLQAGTTP